MADEFTPIAAFADQFGVDFNTAYGWNKDSILQFLQNVSINPGEYNAPKERQPDFELLYADIFALRSPEGDMFKKYHPNQQFLRTKDAVEPTDPIPWINDNKETFFIIFDLLGIFLSLMGVPVTTETLTAKNYSLPLVVLYGKWCQELAHSPKFTPVMAQITWATSEDGKTFYPFLGTSVAGFAKDKVWPGRVREARWAYLKDILQDPYTVFGKSPEVDRMGKDGTNFGNCGETYPFLYILVDAGLVDRSYGIAMIVAAIQGKYEGDKYWKLEPMKPPCVNCKKLLEWFKVPNPINFELYPPPTEGGDLLSVNVLRSTERGENELYREGLCMVQEVPPRPMMA